MNQLSLVEPERWKVYKGRCLCASPGRPCWCAKCTACGKALTKHAFTEEDAHVEARAALDKPGHFQHRCSKR